MKKQRHHQQFHSTRLLIPAFAFLLLFPHAAPSTQKQPGRSAVTSRTATEPPPGFYFEVMPCPRCERCRPCTLNAGWQARMMRVLGASGISSFGGHASGLEKANEEFGLVMSIQRFAKPLNYDTRVYVGPFESERTALAALPDLCSALNEVGNMESSCDEMTAKREGSTFYTRGSFDVSGVRLQSK
ncbi:MAG TPA: hypothetical protein VKN18_29965 [Blastocatellia bacterium]|nr:hypothetical protein [Blastocatellia bacterium]